MVSLTRPAQSKHISDFGGLDVIFVEMNTFYRVLSVYSLLEKLLPNLTLIMSMDECLLET